MLAVTPEEDSNAGWSEVRSRRGQKTTTRGALQETQELNAVRDVNDEKIAITFDWRAAVLAMHQGHATECAAEREVREQNVPSGQWIPNQRSWRTENHCQDEGSTQSMNLRVEEVSKALTSVSKL